MPNDNEFFPPPPPPPRLQRSIGLIYEFEGRPTSVDPMCPSLNNHENERRDRMQTIIDQYPDTGYAARYRRYLDLPDEGNAPPAPGA